MQLSLLRGERDVASTIYFGGKEKGGVFNYLTIVPVRSPLLFSTSNVYAQIKFRKEECALRMGQRRNDAAVKDAPVELSKEQCVLSSGRA